MYEKNYYRTFPCGGDMLASSPGGTYSKRQAGWYLTSVSAKAKHLCYLGPWLQNRLEWGTQMLVGSAVAQANNRSLAQEFAQTSPDALSALSRCELAHLSKRGTSTDRQAGAVISLQNALPRR